VFQQLIQRLFPTRRLDLPDDEWANVLTHLLGIIFSLVAIPTLLITGSAKGMWYHLIGLLVFGLSMLLVYSASTIYHLVRRVHLKKRWQLADHISIYFLIAGTHTPLLLYYLFEFRGFVFLAIIWSLVVIGVVYKIRFFGRYKTFSLFLYLAMGWMAVFTIPFMWNAMSTSCIVWILAGGLSYTFGTIFFVWHKLPYHHAIWHIFVLGGSFSHFMAIYESAAI